MKSAIALLFALAAIGSSCTEATAKDWSCVPGNKTDASADIDFSGTGTNGVPITAKLMRGFPGIWEEEVDEIELSVDANGDFEGEFEVPTGGWEQGNPPYYIKIIEGETHRISSQPWSFPLPLF